MAAAGAAAGGLDARLPGPAPGAAHPPRWQRLQPVLLAAAVLLPVLAALGVVSMGREIAWAALGAPSPSAPAAQASRALTEGLRTGWIALVAALLLARWAFGVLRERGGRGRISLRYPDRTVQVPRGFSVLEASREHGIGHLSVCGGRVGAAVRDSGGLANQFIGDSVMAIFGLDTDLPTACAQAVRAAALIEQRMDAWGGSFTDQFGQPLDFGMGLHAGTVAVGEVGFQDTTTFTAVGEVVNTASRLQDHSKVVAARLVLSLEAARLAGVADALGPPEPVTVRGRSAPLQVLYVAHPARQWGEPRFGGGAPSPASAGLRPDPQ